MQKEGYCWLCNYRCRLLALSRSQGQQHCFIMTSEWPWERVWNKPFLLQEYKKVFAFFTRKWRSSMHEGRNSVFWSLFSVLFFSPPHLSLLFYFGKSPVFKSFQAMVFPGSCTIPFGAVVLFILNHFPTQWSLQMAPFFLQNFTLFPLGTRWYSSPKIYSAGSWGRNCKNSTLLIHENEQWEWKKPLLPCIQNWNINLCQC